MEVAITEYKKQHYIPQTYLNSWCDFNIPEGYDKYVWQFDSTGETAKKKNPKNIFLNQICILFLMTQEIDY